MAHQRKLIRQAVVTLLAAASTAAAGRVLGTRVEPHKKGLLPAIGVYTLSESTDPVSAQTEPRELKRDLLLEITGWVAHSDAVHVDEAMDNLAEQIEAAMDVDRYLAGTAGESILEGTTMQVVEDDGRTDPLIGIVTLTYSVTYRTHPAAPSGLDEFLTTKATHDPAGGVPDTAPAIDQFTVRSTP